MGRIRVLAYNVDGGRAERRPALAAVLGAANADVIALTEADDSAVAADLGRLLGLGHVWAQGSGNRHVAVLSRFPILSWENHTRPPLTQAALEVQLALPDQSTLAVYALHLLPYLLLPFEVRRWQAVGRLLAIIQERRPGPHLILGDLNAVAPGDRVLQRRNPARMRRLMALQFGLIFRLALPRLLRAGYVDCFRRLAPQADGFTWMPGNPTTRYDYILADAQLAPRLRACRVVDQAPAVATASDHLPVLAEFEWASAPAVAGHP
ncbi:MAG: endonuclease/exonuclease/phosphatase family protein [Anaerolineales bacterium]|nr:endonuclease/exonuclease/phosphatase family protein [Anaerolineales bacterium]